jgi:hypothetical protein
MEAYPPPPSLKKLQKWAVLGIFYPKLIAFASKMLCACNKGPKNQGGLPASIAPRAQERHGPLVAGRVTLRAQAHRSHNPGVPRCAYSGLRIANMTVFTLVPAWAKEPGEGQTTSLCANG